jgi:hypothetical protein
MGWGWVGLGWVAALLHRDAKYNVLVGVDIRSVGKDDFLPYLSELAKTWSSALAKDATVSGRYTHRLGSDIEL